MNKNVKQGLKQGEMQLYFFFALLGLSCCTSTSKRLDTSRVAHLIQNMPPSIGIFYILSQNIVKNNKALSECEKGAFAIQTAFDVFKKDKGVIEVELAVLSPRLEDEKRCINFINTVVWNVHSWDRTAKVSSAFLNQRLIQFMALFLEDSELEAYLNSKSKEEKLAMIEYHFLFDGYPEGGYRLMIFLRKDFAEVVAYERMQISLYSTGNAAKRDLFKLINDAINAHFNPDFKPFSVFKKEDFQALQIKQNVINYFTEEKRSIMSAFKYFVDFFGCYRRPLASNREIPIASMSKELLFDKFSCKNDSGIHFYQKEPLLQNIIDHMYALAHPDMYLKGMKKMVIGLPTSGKILSEFPFIDSMCRNARDFEDFIKKTSSSLEIPSQSMVIIDQSSANIYGANHHYLQNMNCAYMRIIHVSKAEAELLADKMGILSSISDWGYGAARNAVFFLAPVIASNSSYDFNEILNAPLDLILRDFNHYVLQSKDSAVFMGDDDTFIPISHYLELLLNCERIIEERIVRAAIRVGRNSSAINFVHPFSFAYYMNARQFALEWSKLGALTMMDGSLSVPRFCAPTIMPGEEDSDGSKETEFSTLTLPLVHYCGPRLPILKDTLSTSPFMMDYDYLRRRLSSSFLGCFLNIPMPHVKIPKMSLIENIDKFVSSYQIYFIDNLVALNHEITQNIDPCTEGWALEVMESISINSNSQEFIQFYKEFRADGKELRKLLIIFLEGKQLPHYVRGIMSKALLYFLKTYAKTAIPERLHAVMQKLI